MTKVWRRAAMQPPFPVERFGIYWAWPMTLWVGEGFGALFIDPLDLVSSLHGS